MSEPRWDSFGYYGPGADLKSGAQGAFTPSGEAFSGAFGAFSLTAAPPPVSVYVEVSYVVAGYVE